MCQIERACLALGSECSFKEGKGEKDRGGTVRRNRRGQKRGEAKGEARSVRHSPEPAGAEDLDGSQAGTLCI